MATYISNRDSGGLTDEKGHLKFLANSYVGNVLDGQKVVENSPTGMSVRVTAGNIRIPYSNYAHMGWSEGFTGVSIATADPSNPRIDRVVAYVDRTMTFNDTDTNNPGSLKYKAVTGTPNAVPSKPSDAAVDSSVGIGNPWCEIGLVTVTAGLAAILNANISDTRVFVTPAYKTENSWTNLDATVSSIVNNGNRSYTFNTDTSQVANISPGTRLKITRTVASPTQSASLNGTNQYFSKSSPTGMTFTDDFTVSAWVKLSSYPSVAASIASRYNGTSGWFFYVEASGQVYLRGANGGAGNVSQVVSYQSLPLNKWVHVSAQLDMSAFTATTTTSYVMFDGVDVPASVARAGTNPTALVQAGNLEIGSYNAGGFFPGKIAQVAVYSAKVTQATMRGYISQGLAGTETSLVSAYSLSNSLTDLNTTNANNLSAQGSATTVNADAPWGQQSNGTISPTVDYAIVQSINGTSVTVQVPEGNTIPASSGVITLEYSAVKAPYGMPVQKEKWRISTTINAQTNTAVLASQATGGFSGINVNAPIGDFNVGLSGTCQQNPASGNDAAFQLALSTSLTAIVDGDLAGGAGVAFATQCYAFTSSFAKEKGVSLSVATPYYLVSKNLLVPNSTQYIGTKSNMLLYADNAYL